jgi:hypothetical protein
MKVGFIAMKRLVPNKGRFSVRSLLLISVMLTLCTSVGVGLELLPFSLKVDVPGVFDRLARMGSAARSTPSPLPDESKPGRVVIAAPKIERPLVHQHLLNLVAAILTVANKIQVNSIKGTYPEQAQPVYSLILARQPADRGPPAFA